VKVVAWWICRLLEVMIKVLRAICLCCCRINNRAVVTVLTSAHSIDIDHMEWERSGDITTTDDIDESMSNTIDSIGNEDNDKISLGGVICAHPNSLYLKTNHVQLGDKTCHIKDYLGGSRWIALIVCSRPLSLCNNLSLTSAVQMQVYSLPPIPCPPHMTLTPHDYQLKAAAQIHFSCEGVHRGMLLGDQMGSGKTLIAILVMWLCREDPGMSLVVAPASLCQQWVDQIDRTFQEVRGSAQAIHLPSHVLMGGDIYSKFDS